MADHAMRHGPDPSLMPLVGREREFATLRAAFSAALAGRGSSVLIGGEAGIGKTTLAEALLSEAVEQGALVLVGRCYDLAETPPYGAWVDLFGHLPARPSLPPLPTAFATQGTVGPVRSQAELCQELLAFVRLIAAEYPLVVFLEDQHWADAASLELLRFLAREIAALPVLLLATYRSTELIRHNPLYGLLPVLVREAQATRHDLRPFDRDELQILVRMRYALPAAIESRLVAYLAGRADGNPFYVGEVLRTLEESRLLRQEGKAWSLGDLAAVGVPPLLRQVIDTRIDRLGTPVRELLAIAAVIGQQVPIALWAAVADAAEETLLALVEQATEAQVLVPTGEGARFIHALIREALYEGILPLRRRAWHRRVAEALTAAPSRAQTAPDPDAVAYHFQQAGDQRAAAWLIKAGERAYKAYVWLHAADQFEAALRLLDERDADPGQRGWLHYAVAYLRRFHDSQQGIPHMDEAARLAAQANDRVLAAHATFYQGVTRAFAARYQIEGLALVRQAGDAFERLTPTERERHVAVGPVDGRFIRGTLVLLMMHAGHLVAAQELAEQCLAEPDIPPPGTRGTETLTNVFTSLAIIYAIRGNIAAAQRMYVEELERKQAQGHYGQVARALGSQLFFITLPYQTDRLAEREYLISQGEAAWEKARGVHGLDSIPAYLPTLWLLEGQWDRLRQLVPLVSGGFLGQAFDGQVLVALATLEREEGTPEQAWTRIGPFFPAGATTPVQEVSLASLGFLPLAARLCLDADDLAEARAWLELYDRWLAWCGARVGLSDSQALWAQYHRQRGDAHQAQQCAGQALALASAPRQPLALLAAHRLLGELATDTGQYGDAGSHLAETLALATACAMPPERAQTLLAQARLAMARGDTPGALATIAAACAILKPLQARRSLARADALSGALDPAPAATTTAQVFPAGLTTREVDVLRLVARGESTVRIAARLSLSPRTITTHLTAIYTKLGVASRAAAIAFAIDHGLR